MDLVLVVVLLAVVVLLDAVVVVPSVVESVSGMAIGRRGKGHWQLALIKMENALCCW